MQTGKEKKPYDQRHKGDAPKFNENDPYIPEDHLVFAIAVTVMCLNPFGIIAIWKSSKVNKLFIEGKFEEARKASDTVEIWCTGTVLLAIVMWLVVIMYI